MKKEGNRWMERKTGNRSLDREWKEGLYSLTSTTKDELINTEMNAVLKCSLDR